MNISTNLKEKRDFICGADSAIYCGNGRGAVCTAGLPAAPKTSVASSIVYALPVCALGWWLCYGRTGRHCR